MTYGPSGRRSWSARTVRLLSGDEFTFAPADAILPGAGTAGGRLGYQGITDSVAVKSRGQRRAADRLGWGVHQRVRADHPGRPGGAIHLSSGHVFRGDLAYADGTPRVDLWDTETRVCFRRSYPVDMPAAVGGPMAFVEVTAGTGNLFAPIDVLDGHLRPGPGRGAPPDADGAPSFTLAAAVTTGTIITCARNGVEDFSGNSQDGDPAHDGVGTTAPASDTQSVIVD